MRVRCEGRCDPGHFCADCHRRRYEHTLAVLFDGAVMSELGLSLVQLREMEHRIDARRAPAGEA